MCQLGAHWRHLANTIEPSMCDGDVALCQITVTTSCCRWQGRHDDTTTTKTTTVLWPFVRDYPGELVPEETLTHPPSWSSSSLFQLLPSTTIHIILLVQITCLAIFLYNLFPSSLVYLLVWSPPPHIPYISSPNQCLHFAAHAHTIATCFAVVSILYHLFIVFLSTPYLELCLLH